MNSGQLAANLADFGAAYFFVRLNQVVEEHLAPLLLGLRRVLVDRSGAASGVDSADTVDGADDNLIEVAAN